VPGYEHVYRTEGIVLRRHDLGETDRILTLYTRDRGKIRAVAKGVRKPSSKKAGHVELFVRADMLLAEGRTLDVLTQVELLDAYVPLRHDLMRASYAAHIVELVDSFTEDADESRPIFNLLRDGLTWIAHTSDLQRTARYFELRMLELGGYRPELFRCVVCERAIEAVDQFYSTSEGGVVCLDCAAHTPRLRPLSLRALKVLRYMQRNTIDVVEQLALGAPVQTEAERLLYDVLTYHLERRLKSAVFLERLRRENIPVSGLSDPASVQDVVKDEESTD
jgi:DNA repair protein RecO (recombination protein O)